MQRGAGVGAHPSSQAPEHYPKTRYLTSWRLLKIPDEVLADEVFLYCLLLPETMTGKYMRRVVHDLVCGTEIKDMDSLRNPECLDDIRSTIQDWQLHEDKSSAIRASQW